jgi:hypothetical protein
MAPSRQDVQKGIRRATVRKEVPFRLGNALQERRDIAGRKASLNMGKLRRIAAVAGMIGCVGPAHAAIPETVNPGLKVVTIRPTNLEPMVTGLGFLSDGRLVVAHWGGLHADVDKLQTGGKIFIMSGVAGDNPSPTFTTYAQSLEDPVGMLVKDDKIYVSGGQKLIELPDANKDGKADAARVICTLPGTHARHEFLFGLMFKDGKFWMSPSSSKDNDGTSPGIQRNPNRGTTMSVDPTTGAFEIFAMGLREPNGMGIGPDDELFIPDVQGTTCRPTSSSISAKGVSTASNMIPPRSGTTRRNTRPSSTCPSPRSPRPRAIPCSSAKATWPGTASWARCSWATR